MKGQIKYTVFIYLLLLFLVEILSITLPTNKTIEIQKYTHKETIKVVPKYVDKDPPKIASKPTQKDVIQRMSEHISKVYKVDPTFAQRVVIAAYKYEHSNFPKAVDILAIIAIESSFKKYAVSNANAVGIMQILYKKSSFDIHDNMQDGVSLLKEYNRRLPIGATIQAYNVGIGNYRKGVRNYNYLYKFNKVKQQLERI